MSDEKEEAFIGFQCPSCGTEIEASLDMCGTETECPACGAEIAVPTPADDGVVRHGQDDYSSKSRTQALKGRTIRIELDDL